MHRKVKHERRESLKREVIKNGNRRLPDGTPVTNKPSNVAGEKRTTTAVRRILNRGDRRRATVELREVAKQTSHDDDIDIRGKLMPNLISASSRITS